MTPLLNQTARTLVAAATLFVAAASAQAQGVTGDVQAGQKKAEMCIGCHGIPGYKTAFPDVYHVPKIAGQQPDLGKFFVEVLVDNRRLVDNAAAVDEHVPGRQRCGELLEYSLHGSPGGNVDEDRSRPL